MRILYLLIFLGSAQIACAQSAQTVRLEKLLNLLSTPDDRILIVNFWATWCAPCVKELPLFERLQSENRPDVRVLLVSMDLDLDPNPEKVYKFIERKKMKAEVVLLNEPDPNSWINKIEKSWSGALPATLVINPQNGKRKFVETELKEGDLERLLADVNQ